MAKTAEVKEVRIDVNVQKKMEDAERMAKRIADQLNKRSEQMGYGVGKIRNGFLNTSDEARNLWSEADVFGAAKRGYLRAVAERESRLIGVLFSHSERVSVEKKLSDGSIKKESVFKFKEVIFIDN